MYCPRCEIKTEDTFCENCGGVAVVGDEIETVEVTEQAEMTFSIEEEVKREKLNVRIRKISLKKIFSKVVIITVIMGALIGYNILKEEYTPRRTVQRFYDYLVNKDYKSAYKMLVNTDDNLLSEDMFKISMEKLDFNQFTIRKFEPEEYKQVYYDPENPNNFNINDKGDMFSVQAGGRIYPVSVVDTGKRLLLFKDYRLNADNFTVKWQVTAPTGTKISIKGKDFVKSSKPNIDSIHTLNSFYKPSSLNYDIEHIFYGSYDVVAIMEGAKEVIYKETMAGQNINVKFLPSDELIKELEDKARNFIELYYSNATQEQYINLLTTDSNALIKNIKSEGFANDKVVNKVKNIKVTKQSIDDIEHATISVNCTIDYEDNTLLSWGGQKQIGTRDMETEFYFIKQNGKWLIGDTGYIY